MAMTNWTTTAALNVLATTGINCDEGMPPSAVNDSMREIMAVLKTSIDTGGLTATGTTFNLINATATTINFAGAASVALNIGHASAAAAFAGGISIPTGKSVTGAGTAAISGFALIGATMFNGPIGGAGATPAAATVTTLSATGTITGASAGNTLFVMGTADGSDLRALQFSGGGALGPTRGAGLQLYGNESGATGKVFIDAGNVSGGQILLRTGNNLTAVTIDESQNCVLSAALILNATASPTGTGAGSVGQIAWDTSYLYVCTATNDWRRVALTDF